MAREEEKGRGEGGGQAWMWQAWKEMREPQHIAKLSQLTPPCPRTPAHPSPSVLPLALRAVL